MSLNELQEYARNYNRAVFRFMASGRAAPTEARLARFEESVDFRFPDEFRQLTLSPLGGFCLEVPGELWDRPAELMEGDWKNLYSLKLFGIGIGVPDWLNLRLELESLPPEDTDIVPFMARGCEPERFCFDLDYQIVLWSPRTGERRVVKEDFYSLIMKEIHGLEERWERYKVEGRPKKRKKK